MGCCSYSHELTEKDILRVSIFGLENSGKTSLVHCLKTSNRITQTSNYISTHGVIGVNAHLSIQTDLNLLIFDYGGCKHQRHIWPHLINNCDVILFTVDSHDSVCFHDAKQALFDLLTDESLRNKPLLIVFTKSDKMKTINLHQLERALDLVSIEDRSIHRVLFSSMTLDGLTSISAWFDYFSYCKLHGKAIEIPRKSRLSSSKHRLPNSLNLSTLTSASIVSNSLKTKESNRLTVSNHPRRKRNRN